MKPLLQRRGQRKEQLLRRPRRLRRLLRGPRKTLLRKPPPLQPRRPLQLRRRPRKPPQPRRPRKPPQQRRPRKLPQQRRPRKPPQRRRRMRMLRSNNSSNHPLLLLNQLNHRTHQLRQPSVNLPLLSPTTHQTPRMVAHAR
ncbi:Hypothetical protein, putative [Bodo saltans]|uniref:Uncharacterized protein n=1 Tax=Bodo saltans TaxID=75058 RepID=A0A0S4J381_BODSA|nr:Hypothetical protein, putative [Bodo saltans]|eukprot:CUG06742.1 Hypothetical protein, putative [Bodo saltans]